MRGMKLHRTSLSRIVINELCEIAFRKVCAKGQLAVPVSLVTTFGQLSLLLCTRIINWGLTNKVG